MDMALLTCYGIDGKKGLSRCLNDEKLYRMLLGMFMKEDAFDRAKAAMAAGDLHCVFQCAHELKGASGNASLTDLYNALCPRVDLVRVDGADQAEAQRLFADVEAAYVRARQGVEEFLA